MQRNCRSRFMSRWASSHSRSLGPRVPGNGLGSRIVKCSVPAVVRHRWQSLSITGRDDPGKRAGRYKEWIAMKRFDAYGSDGVGDGVVRG
jgi:hypothetical protein